MKKMYGSLFIIIMLFALTPTASADQVHYISKGETLTEISNQYNISLSKLMNENQYLRNPGAIFPGQVLIIPNNYYKVKKGDTLSSISRKVGLSMRSIANANQLKNWNELYIGQNLLIPNVYTVKPGDSLYGIAKKLDVTMVELAGENNLNDWNNLYIGQELKLPEEDDIDTERYLEPTAKKFPNTFYYKGSEDRPQVALTFDDGPYNFYTEKVLDILKAYNVKATFFVLGQNIGGKQQILQRMISEGHTVANHTWTHPNLIKLSEQQVTTEITKTNQMIESAAGVVPNLIRPPYGFVSNQNIEQIQGMDKKIIKWSVDSFDWRDKNVDKIFVNILPDIKSGSILLFHDTYPNGTSEEKTATIDTLPHLIKTLKGQGYNFVTIDEMLGVQPYKH